MQRLKEETTKEEGLTEMGVEMVRSGWRSKVSVEQSGKRGCHLTKLKFSSGG